MHPSPHCRHRPFAVVVAALALALLSASAMPVTAAASTTSDVDAALIPALWMESSTGTAVLTPCGTSTSCYDEASTHEPTPLMVDCIGLLADRRGTLDFAWWERQLPDVGMVGTGWTPVPGDRFGLRTTVDVADAHIEGGTAAAVHVDAADVTISRSLLAGATDGLKPARNTLLRDSVVSVRYGVGAHADHVQVTDHDGITLERVRMVAENAAGATDDGWNAAIFIHGTSTDWRIEDVYVQAGRPEVAIRSWYPVRLNSGRGHVDGLVVDRAVMRGPTPVLVIDGVVLETWRDVYIRESDGSLTPVPRP